MMKEKRSNKNIFLPMGIIFMGVGAVFLAAVNSGIGGALIGMGVVFIIVGITKKAN